MSATSQRNGRAPRVIAPVPAPPAPAMPEGSALAEAVLAVQAKAPKLIRDAKGEVQGSSKDGRAYSYSYGYVTLDAVVDAVLPLLVEHQLLWRTMPSVNEHGQPSLRYRMTHVASGESEEGEMLLLLAKADMQGLGSGITYARRYALCAYLNLTADTDDDGGHASTPTPATSQSASQPSAAAGKGSERPCTAPQRKMLRAKAAAAGLDTGALANVMKASWGDEPVTWSDEEAAGRFVDRALDRLPARLVDTVIAGIEGSGAS